MGNIAWRHVILGGWPILSILFGVSIYSFSVMLEKWKLFSKIEKNSNLFLDSIRKSDLQKVIAFCEKSSQPLALLTIKIIKAGHPREDKERVMHRTIQNFGHAYEKKISALGTIAAVSPFIGLLGTVIGIIKAFHGVASSNVAGASQVSMGIAEALVGTAGGLVVAIPAVLAYNYFVNQLRHVIQELENAGAEVIDWLLEKGS